jgi:DNA uptake protein ComE-like DNA-binding protein
VSSRSRESSNPADAWLLEGVTPGTREEGEATSAPEPKPAPQEKPLTKKSQWLPTPTAAPPAKAGAEQAPAEKAPAEKEPAERDTDGDRKRPAKRAPAKPSRPSRAERALRARIEQLESELASTNEELADAAKETGPKLRASKRLEKAQQTIKEQKKERAELAKRIRELQTELRRETKRADAATKKESANREARLAADFAARESELNERIATLTAQLESARGERAEAKQAKPRATRRRTAAETAKRSTKRANGKLDVNAASFEELRNLGLSVTQSARLIAYRDVRGGYKSLDELDDIPGLSEATKKDLRAELELGAG